MSHSLNQFINFLSVSPPSGLVIAEKSSTLQKVQNEVIKIAVPNVVFEINSESNASDFFQAVNKALEQKAWLILNIKTSDLPSWFFEQIRTLSGTGHLYNKERNIDVPLNNIRVLAVISKKDIKDSPFETFQSCFGIVFRE